MVNIRRCLVEAARRIARPGRTQTWNVERGTWNVERGTEQNAECNKKRTHRTPDGTKRRTPNGTKWNAERRTLNVELNKTDTGQLTMDN
jgi:hypothetical protein